MYYTTVEGLQGTIDALGDVRKYPTLNILASREIPELLPFHAPSSFEELKVLRCARRDDQGTLMINGSSTYAKVRLDEWQERKRYGHTLVLGFERGVRIKLSNVANLQNWGRCRDTFSEAETAEVEQKFKELPPSTGSWDNAKGTVAAIMGIVVGGGKFCMSLKASGAVGGLCFKYSFGIHSVQIGMAGAKFSAVATAAGSGLVLGMAAAAAVYYIPWGSLLDWLQGALCSIWNVVSSFWQSFKDWVMRLFSSSTTHEGRGAGGGLPRPMRFS